MADIEHSITINAARDKVWESWDRFGEIARFNTALRASSLLEGSAATGTGARRRCDLKNGKNYLKEQIGDYIAQELMEVLVFDTDLPVKTVQLRFSFSAPSASATKIDVTGNFTMKFGVLGKLLKIVARKGLRADVARLLQSNKTFNEAA